MTLLLVLIFAAGQPECAADAQALGLLLKARYALAAGNAEKALSWTEEAMRLTPDSADAAFLRMEILIPERVRSSGTSRQKLLGHLQELHRLAQRFSSDYRFSKKLGSFLVRSPGEWPAAESPVVYLTRAATLLQGVAGKEDEAADTYYDLGRWHLELEQYFDASQAFRTVCRLDSETSWGLYFAGKACEYSQQLRSALDFYRRFSESADQEPWQNRPPVDMHILKLQTILDPSPERLESLTQRLKQPGADGGHTLNLAGQFNEIGLHRACLQLLETVPQSMREGPYHSLAMGARMALREYDRVLTDAEGLLEETTDDRIRKILLDHALEAAMLLGRFDRVAALNERYSETPGLSLKLAAFNAFGAALSRGDERPWQQVAARFGETKFIREAQPVVRERGLVALALKNLVGLYMDHEDWQGALNGLMHYSGGSFVKEDLAVLYYFNGKPERSFELFEELLAAAPDRHDLRNNYGYFLAEQGVHLDRAEAMLIEALRHDEESSTYLDSLGWIRFKKGRYERAEELVLRSLEGDPKNPEKLEHLGDIYHAMGRVVEARKAWSMALESRPGRFFQILDKLDPP